jgi:hypothetical protein
MTCMMVLPFCDRLKGFSWRRNSRAMNLKGRPNEAGRTWILCIWHARLIVRRVPKNAAAIDAAEQKRTVIAHHANAVRH